jgi:hypothetical protein
MAETHHHPYNTGLYYGPSTGSESIQVTDLHDVVPPPMPKAGKSKDTVLNAPGAVSQSSPGWREAGEAKFVAYHKETQFGNLLTIMQSGPGPNANRSWLYQAPPDGNETIGFKVQWTGYITDLVITKAEVENDEKLMNEVSIQQSGDTTFTAGSPTA